MMTDNMSKNNTTILPRMRSIKQAITEIKAVDPDSALTEKALRRLVNIGVIPYIAIGTKKLININLVYQMMSNSELSAAPNYAVNGIRPVRA